MRLAVATTSAPPAPSGQARVLAQLLEGHDVTWLTEDALAVADGRIVRMPPRAHAVLPAIWRPHALRDADRGAAFLAVTLRRARAVARAGRGADAIIGCSGSPFDLPAAFLAARWLRKPLLAWMFDDPVLQWAPDAGPGYRAFARAWERRWAVGACAIAPNEVLAGDFAARNTAAPPAAILRNPAAEAAFGPPDASEWPGVATILYTGSMYSAQADAVRNLCAALGHLPGFRLVLRTPQSVAEVASLGIGGPAVEVLPALDHTAALAEQKRAQVLFLPLAFDSAIPEVIRSSAPAKAAEYLASGRPVLVHAPRGTVVARMFAGGAGIVVDVPEPAALACALRGLRDNGPAARAAMAAEAGRRAEAYRLAAARGALGCVLDKARSA